MKYVAFQLTQPTTPTSFLPFAVLSLTKQAVCIMKSLPDYVRHNGYRYIYWIDPVDDSKHVLAALLFADQIEADRSYSHAALVNWLEYHREKR
jgi:hypothetical protein